MKQNFKDSFGLQLHITDDCDQRCKHCYIFNDKNFIRSNLSLNDIKQIIDNFEEFCMAMKCNPSIAITGGDPLLREDIWDILNYFKSKEMKFDILGNPFHLSSTVANRLKAYGCQIYQLSIDGLEDTHDKIRKVGSFASTINAIEILNNAGIKSHIMMTISKLNYKEAPKVAELVSKIPVDGFGFARYCPTVLDRGISNISPNEYKEFLSSMWDTYVKLSDGHTQFFLKDHLWIPFLYEKGLFEKSDNDMIFEGCGCAIRHMCVLANGDVYACRRFTSLIGNCLTSKFADIFFEKGIEQYRDFEKMECYNCELFNYCRGCPAVAYGTYGSFYKKDPQCWFTI